MKKDKLLNQILSKRDYSGSPEDEYAQNIEVFHHHSLLQNREEDFLSLIEKSIAENKKIVIEPIFEQQMEGVNYDEIPFEKLILV